MKETALFLLSHIESEVAIIDSITTDPEIETCVSKIMHLTEMAREVLG